MLCVWLWCVNIAFISKGRTFRFFGKRDSILLDCLEWTKDRTKETPNHITSRTAHRKENKQIKEQHERKESNKNQIDNHIKPICTLNLSNRSDEIKQCLPPCKDHTLPQCLLKCHSYNHRDLQYQATCNHMPPYQCTPMVIKEEEPKKKKQRKIKFYLVHHKMYIYSCMLCVTMKIRWLRSSWILCSIYIYIRMRICCVY